MLSLKYVMQLLADVETADVEYVKECIAKLHPQERALLRGCINAEAAEIVHS